jgi:hypothetical protein
MLIKPGRYRHYKGKEYIVIGEATHTETKEQMVIYQQDYDDFKLWVRPKELFEGTVEIGGSRTSTGEIVNRFTYVGPWCCCHCTNPCNINGLGG